VEVVATVVCSWPDSTSLASPGNRKPHVVQNFAPGLAGVPQLGQLSIIPFHDPGHALAAAQGRAFAPHGTSRFAERDRAHAAIGLAGTRLRCDNPNLMEQSHSESGIGSRQPARRSIQE
jgi:hypothetical protein